MKRKCIICGEDISGRRADCKVCGDVCRERLYRKRMRFFIEKLEAQQMQQVVN